MDTRLGERYCAYDREGEIMTDLPTNDFLGGNLFDDKEIIQSHKTVTVTQSLKTDIIQFLVSKYTSNATISIAEVMSMYKCPEDRAKRVLKSLVNDGVLERTEIDSYTVII